MLVLAARAGVEKGTEPGASTKPHVHLRDQDLDAQQLGGHPRPLRSDRGRSHGHCQQPCGLHWYCCRPRPGMQPPSSVLLFTGCIVTRDITVVLL